MADLNKRQRTTRRQFISQTRTKAIGIDTTSGNQRAEILNSLSKFAQAGSVEVNRQQRVDIETNKAIGASRAAEDLTKVEQERQGITSEDTNATKAAYNNIVSRHETLEAGNSFANWYQSNPNASEEEIADKKTELYKPILEKYGDDEVSLKQASLHVQESQFGLVPIQNKIKQNYEHQTHMESLNYQIGDILADPNADTDSLVDEEIPEIAKSLKISEFEYKKVLMQTMVDKASQGDRRLLDKLSGTKWAKDSVLISKASNSYDTYTNRENSILIGDALGEIGLENSKLTVPWETTLRKLDNLNEQFPNSVSPSKVESLKRARAASVKSEKDNTDMTRASWNNLYNEGGIPLAMDDRWSPEDKKSFVKQVDATFSDKTAELVEQGYSQAEAGAAIMKQRLAWSKVNATKMPLLDEYLTGLIGLNPENYPTSDDLPSFFQEGINTLQAMDEASVDLYFSSREDKVFAQNLKSGLKHRDAYSAFKRAYNVKTQPFKVSSTLRTDVIDSATSALDKKLEVGFIDEYIGGEVETPDWVKEQLRARVEEEALLNVYNGMLDADGNAEQSVATVMSGYEKVYNGTFINQHKSVIAKEAGLASDLEDSKLAAAADSETVDKALASFIEANEELILAETGDTGFGDDGLDASDISFNFNNNGTFTITNQGEQIGGRFNVSDLKETYKSVDLKEQMERSMKARKSKEERRRAVDDILTRSLF